MIRTVRTVHLTQSRDDKSTLKGKTALWATGGWLEGNWNKKLKWACWSVEVQLA